MDLLRENLAAAVAAATAAAAVDADGNSVKPEVLCWK